MYLDFYSKVKESKIQPLSHCHVAKTDDEAGVWAVGKCGGIVAGEVSDWDVIAISSLA